MKKIFLMALFAVSICSGNNVYAQATERFNSSARILPFSTTLFGVTVTGTYSDGCLKSKTVNGTNILWGLISWGGSTEISCTPGCSFCKIETVISVGRITETTNSSGEKCFNQLPVPAGITPVFVGIKDGAFTFAVDISQTAAHHQDAYREDFFILSTPFVLDPGAVKELGLISSVEQEQMGYMIPAGRYPLYRDGNIFYWTFQPPKE